jgi:hypothetical protein
MSYRTDRHHNPAALITDLAAQAGLKLGTDYLVGDPFLIAGGKQLYTARLLGDPLALTIRVIDAVGYYTREGFPRWSYIALPSFVWAACDKKRVISFHYAHEGGKDMAALFA